MWVQSLDVDACPIGWQQPAKTEKWAYEKISRLPKAKFTNFFCFPWATLIDLLRTQHLDKASPFLEALAVAPPRNRLIRATVCQHIYAKDMLPWFKKLKITDLYWSHASDCEHNIEGIRIHPFPLYPVRCDDMLVQSRLAVSIIERPMLYSFIGAFSPQLYLSSVREWIFNLPERQDAKVKFRHEWHYEKQVYGEQMAELKLDAKAEQSHAEASYEYSESLCNTIFSLCPSGSGPNSIRLWESLGFGCIPVIMSDQLRLPGKKSEWEAACVFVREEEDAVKCLPAKLELLAQDKMLLQKMQAAGQVLWKKYGERGVTTLLSPLADPKYIAGLLNQ